MFLNKKFFIALLLLSLIPLIHSCTSQKPAVKKDATTETALPPPPPETKNERGCEMYGGNEKKAKAAISLYRDDFKAGNYQRALPNWRWVFENAPGLREQTFKDGDVIYKKLMEETTDEKKKAAYFDTLMLILDQRAICWGKSAFLTGKKALAYHKNYPEQEDKIFDFIEKAVINGGNDTPASQLTLYWRMLLKRRKASKISNDDLIEAYERIKEICIYNIDNGNPKGYQDILAEMEPGYAKFIEIISTPKVTDCPSTIEYFSEKYNASPNDLDVVKSYYGTLAKFKCFENPVFFEILEKYISLDPDPSASRLKTAGNFYRKNKNSTKALEYYEQAAAKETDPMKKAKILLSMALIAAYEQPKKDFPKARKFAQEAASLSPNWGAPYILIGRMYAGSGKLCGPGTGFESQKVLWPAMEMWEKAKRTDPSSADEAQKYINEYYQYLPERKDIFQRGVQEGSMYSIGCWIGGKSKVRVRK